MGSRRFSVSVDVNYKGWCLLMASYVSDPVLSVYFPASTHLNLTATLSQILASLFYRWGDRGTESLSLVCRHRAHGGKLVYGIKTSSFYGEIKWRIGSKAGINQGEIIIFIYIIAISLSVTLFLPQVPHCAVTWTLFKPWTFQLLQLWEFVFSSAVIWVTFRNSLSLILDSQGPLSEASAPLKLLILPISLYHP